MKWLGIAVILLMLSTFVSTPAFAQDMPGCEMTTIESLADCVGHAGEMGQIDNAGVLQSLLAKVQAAEALQSRGQTSAAINTLQAFISEVQAQAGIHIDEMHAQHMVMHAQMVIDALTG